MLKRLDLMLERMFTSEKICAELKRLALRGGPYSPNERALITGHPAIARSLGFKPSHTR